MIKTKTVPEELIAVIPYTGCLKKTSSLLRELEEWLRENDANIKGPGFVILYTSPLKEDGRYDVGFPIEEEVEGSDRVNIVTIPEHKVLYTFYKNSGRRAAYESLIAFVEENNLDVIGSPKEVYHEDSVEIQFPII
ncbi:MAG TPA: GyrI-like domain-containing protein [Methanothermobacter sp.]|nr:predicted transcriptional regulator [Methanothermobacter sp. MT-2]HHW05463.1 transcriptional regulator [Methanothermobacter sp.]HOK73201.1 GyrI-like domain-containing protein [Methanothermobacter sp.]HOL68851.1 GyrI-like domain-containing protein [Methanothermobacter sp.]HPQ04744.1 GyrI-like domain-containing protein [Methanothermobacter sp.]